MPVSDGGVPGRVMPPSLVSGLATLTFKCRHMSMFNANWRESRKIAHPNSFDAFAGEPGHTLKSDSGTQYIMRKVKAIDYRL